MEITEIFTAKKTKKLATGGNAGVTYYCDVEILDDCGLLVLGKHKDGNCGIYRVQAAAPNFLEQSRVTFGETPRANGSPAMEIRTADEPTARAKWDAMVYDIRLYEVEQEERKAKMEATEKLKATARETKALRIQKLVGMKQDAIETLREALRRPSTDVTGSKVNDLASLIARTDIILKHL